MKISLKLLATACLALFASCATPPENVTKHSSYAFQNTGDTVIGERVSSLLAPREPQESGFYVMPDGLEALGSRLRLADLAQRSIDAQYFIVEDDLVGILFIDRLISAADRGVRVRLLIDDMYLLGDDAAIAAIDQHPNIELRVFNPFAERSSARVFEFVTDLQRVNHRMHNKSFIADNQVAVLGGRNMANEYFDASRTLEFGDLDLAGFGPVVKDASKAFDAYWNSDFAIPAQALIASHEEQSLAELRESHVRTIADSGGKYLDALQNSIIDGMLDPQFPLFWGTAEVVYDNPQKVQIAPEEVKTVRSLLAPKVKAAQSELVITSPYFVVLDDVKGTLLDLRDRGVRVVVLTNSLASTDMVPAHSGYSKSRRLLLEKGVEIHEVKPDTSFDESGREDSEATRSALHMKLFVLDRRYTFVGSFNWDPRSVSINTEVGYFIDSPELANWAATTLEERMPVNSYLVQLNDEGEMEWLEQLDTGQIIYSQEPKTDALRRFKSWFYGTLPLEKNL